MYGYSDVDPNAITMDRINALARLADLINNGAARFTRTRHIRDRFTRQMITMTDEITFTRLAAADGGDLLESTDVHTISAVGTNDWTGAEIVMSALDVVSAMISDDLRVRYV